MARRNRRQPPRLTFTTLRRVLPTVLPILVLLILYEFALAIFTSPRFPEPIGGWLHFVDDEIALWVLGIGWVGMFTGGWGYMSIANMYWDLLAFGMVCILFVALATGYSVLRAFQVTSLVIMILPLGVYLGGSNEIYWQVADFQLKYGVLPWFSNLDLLYLTALVFAGTSLLDGARRFKEFKKSTSR